MPITIVEASSVWYVLVAFYLSHTERCSTQCSLEETLRLLQNQQSWVIWARAWMRPALMVSICGHTVTLCDRRCYHRTARQGADRGVLRWSGDSNLFLRAQGVHVLNGGWYWVFRVIPHQKRALIIRRRDDLCWSPLISLGHHRLNGMCPHCHSALKHMKGCCTNSMAKVKGWLC